MIESIKIELGGKEREIKFDLGIMSDYEDLTGDNALMDAIFQKITAKKLIAMIYVVLKVNEPEITLGQCGHFVTAENMEDVLVKFNDAFNLGLPDSNKKKVTKK